jgi:uncharacterized protein (TIGR00255 family)
MIRSMTGYGKAVGEYAGKTITAEVKSLNSKFLELMLRLPSAYKEKELELRSEFSKTIERGKTDVNVTIEVTDGITSNTLNTEAITAYIEELKKIETSTNLSPQNFLGSVLSLPYVVNTDKGEADEKEWVVIQQLITSAINSFNDFRKAEGANISKDLTERILIIDNLLSELEKFEKERMDNVRNRLLKNIETITNVEYDKNRFEQELIYYLEKLDISEEKIRLRSHLTYFLETVKSKDNNGKKLGFITQEIGREINTIGSKANDADMQRLVVQMKDEAEKLKEQLANVL